jgi:type IV pilus assembly protein PilA
MSQPEAPATPPPEPASRKKKGLSLVWGLVVVVAILSCLGAIATPKFVGFRCKSKQSEAKTNLSGLYTAEKTFYGEHGFYTTDLVSLEWKPDGSPTYAYGFASPSEARSEPASLDPSRRTTFDPRVATGEYAITNMKTLAGHHHDDDDLLQAFAAATATSSSFIAVAIGDIDTDTDGAGLDVWTIDEKRNLQVVLNDCWD